MAIAANPFASPRFRVLVPEMEREFSCGWNGLRKRKRPHVQATPPMELGVFEPPTSWVRCRQNMLTCSTFLMACKRLQKTKYAGICTDMRRVRRFWRKVPEIRGGGWNELRRPQQEASGRAILAFGFGWLRV